jgi:hypothetical protein
MSVFLRGAAAATLALVGLGCRRTSGPPQLDAAVGSTEVASVLPSPSAPPSAPPSTASASDPLAAASPPPRDERAIRPREVFEIALVGRDPPPVVVRRTIPAGRSRILIRVRSEAWRTVVALYAHFEFASPAEVRPPPVHLQMQIGAGEPTRSFPGCFEDQVSGRMGSDRECTINVGNGWERPATREVVVDFANAGPAIAARLSIHVLDPLE